MKSSRPRKKAWVRALEPVAIPMHKLNQAVSKAAGLKNHSYVGYAPKGSPPLKWALMSGAKGALTGAVTGAAGGALGAAITGKDPVEHALYGAGGAAVGGLTLGFLIGLARAGMSNRRKA